jgi:UDP-N-acetylglucosamine:LPS N-acetylglucosamine transferase
LGFEETRQQLAANCPVRFTGIPVTRPDASGMGPAEEAISFRAGPGRLVILGDGSASRTMNAVLPRAIGRLQEHMSDWRVVHRMRGDEVRPVKRLYRRFGIDAVTTGHIHNLPGLLARSDLVIAATPPSDVVELATSATPIVAAIGADAPDCVQVQTAKTLAQRGACTLVEQPDQEQAWTRVLEPLVRDSGHRRQLAVAMQSHFRNDAAWHVAGMIRDLISSAARTCVA